MGFESPHPPPFANQVPLKPTPPSQDGLNASVRGLNPGHADRFADLSVGLGLSDTLQVGQSNPDNRFGGPTLRTLPSIAIQATQGADGRINLGFLNFQVTDRRFDIGICHRGILTENKQFLSTNSVKPTHHCHKLDDKDVI